MQNNACGINVNGRVYLPSYFHLLCYQAIVLSNDGHNLVTGGDNGVVEVWQACDFKQLYVYPGCDAGIRALDLSHDQRSEQTLRPACNIELTQNPSFSSSSSSSLRL